MPPYSRIATPAKPVIGSAAQRDPRGAGNPFNPQRQPDEMAQDYIRHTVQNGLVPIEEILSRLDANNLPPQLTQATFPALIASAGAGGAVLLIPRNLRRQSWRVLNPTLNGDIAYSFGKPLPLGGALMGVPIAAPGADQETNGSVTLNDIWVFSNNLSTKNTFPIPVIGYEGTIAITGNPR